jgi:hypothetical protein
MRLALNVAKMAKEGILRTAIEETKYRIKKSLAEVREEKKRGVEFPGHNKVNAAIHRHPAMLRQNQTPGCLPCQNGTAKNPQTCWRRKGTGAPPRVRHRLRTPQPTPHPPDIPPTPPAPPGNISEAQPSEVVNLPARYTYSHTALPCAEFFDNDEITQHDPDFDSDMVTDERYYTIC